MFKLNVRYRVQLSLSQAKMSRLDVWFVDKHLHVHVYVDLKTCALTGRLLLQLI